MFTSFLLFFHYNNARRAAYRGVSDGTVVTREGGHPLTRLFLFHLWFLESKPKKKKEKTPFLSSSSSRLITKPQSVCFKSGGSNHLPLNRYLVVFSLSFCLPAQQRIFLFALFFFFFFIMIIISFLFLPFEWEEKEELFLSLPHTVHTRRTIRGKCCAMMGPRQKGKLWWPLSVCSFRLVIRIYHVTFSFNKMKKKSHPETKSIYIILRAYCTVCDSDHQVLM